MFRCRASAVVDVLRSKKSPSSRKSPRWSGDPSKAPSSIVEVVVESFFSPTRCEVRSEESCEVARSADWSFFNHRARLLCVDFFLRRCSSLSPRVLYLYPGGRSHSVLLRRCSSSSPRDLCLFPGGRSHSVLLRRCFRKSPSAGGFGAESFSLSIVIIFPRPVALGRLCS